MSCGGRLSAVEPAYRLGPDTCTSGPSVYVLSRSRVSKASTIKPREADFRRAGRRGKRVRKRFMVHLLFEMVCDNRRHNASGSRGGAQTGRPGVAVAGEGFAWRQGLTGRFASRVTSQGV